MATLLKSVLKKRRRQEESSPDISSSDDSDSSSQSEEEQKPQKSARRQSSDSKGPKRKQSKDSEKKQEEEEEDPLALSAFRDQSASEKEWKNRQRTLVLASRGINHRFRHLISDLYVLLPQAKKDSKQEKKSIKDDIDDICFDRSCNNFLYFEQKKKQDLFLWISKSPNGPSFKCAVQNIHTTEELKMTGNCLKHSRPLLSFDKAFEEETHLKLLKEMLVSCFNTPKNHPKSKPFIDHVFSFTYFDGRVWFRNYQIVNQQEEKFTEKDDIEKLNLIEIGPRFCLQPIKAFEGSMGGEPLWQNSKYISPSKKRSKKFTAFVKKRQAKEDRKSYKEEVMRGAHDKDAFLSKAF